LLTKKQTWLGKDFTIYAGLASGIDGIIQSDEMPVYGFSEPEVEDIKQRLELKDDDAFVIALGDETMVDAALEAVRSRAMMYFDGVPEDVRRGLPENTTEYMRPLPGAARMYPETDVPPIRITQKQLQELHRPEKPSEKQQRLSKQYHLHEEQIHQLLSSGYEDCFEKYVTRYPGLENVILRTYINTLVELQKEGIPTQNIDETTLNTVFSALREGRFAKEAVPQILSYLCVHPMVPVEEAILGCGIKRIREEEIIQLIHTVLSERKDFVKQKGTNAVGPLMGVVMKQLRGKADGQLINKLLLQEIEKVISS
jgi:glutamyl-tRNA(Gln) amidotransferase subunit E